MEISGDLCEWEKIQGISLVITPSFTASLLTLAVSPRCQSDEAVRVRLRERGRDVLVLQRASSERPPLSSLARGGGREETRNRR